MKAAIITAAGKPPVYGDFNEPVASEGNEVVTVSAAALVRSVSPAPRGHITAQIGISPRWQGPTE
jgi:hypothetical protein